MGVQREIVARAIARVGRAGYLGRRTRDRRHDPPTSSPTFELQRRPQPPRWSSLEKTSSAPGSIAYAQGFLPAPGRDCSKLSRTVHVLSGQPAALQDFRVVSPCGPDAPAELTRA